MVLTACVLASSMAFIDGTALPVALPILRADFGADLASVQWVLNGYMLALASLTLIGGALADVYGKARMLGLGCVLFGVTSAACALAPSPTWLIAARIAQGAAAAIVTPASLALIGATYPRAERNRAIGLWAAASALTTAGGPVLGGWLTETFGWPSVFWINPPLALAAVGVLLVFAPKDGRIQRRFDLIGAAILAAAIGALTWALSQIGSAEALDATSTPAQPVTVLMIVAWLGIVGLAVYAFWERRSEHPMTPPRLLENRAFLGLNVATLMIYAAVSIMFFVLPFDLVDRRALSSTDAGLAFLPFTLGVGLMSNVFGRLADKIGARAMLIAGPAGAALAYVWMALGRAESLMLGVIGPVTLLGLSFAVLVAPLTASVLSSVNQADEGLASGINNAASRIAQLAGVAFAAGVAPFASGYEVGLAVAAATSIAGAFTALMTLAPRAAKAGVALSEPASAAGSGSHGSESRSGDQTRDRAMISAQAEDQ
ncbi:MULTISPECIES: MFS transporter [Bradyrhizobium]|jgi:EmrB/QacA subfamily drug resistance transporter|uniref:MFS transporter n=1 Tax=Bradyrhizobium elkanii TaxID=29448 RepID=UPI002714A636|nr:MFS transporter [Bradyrhizobium elkanii]WLA49689.1 MFS transporter [Bradyrhizobium elkanii]WLB80075.1 MFS transporter [Bradyrhizobium elkanii]